MPEVKRKNIMKMVGSFNMRSVRQVAMAIAVLPLIAACTMDEPTKITEKRVEIHEGAHDVAHPTRAFTDREAALLASHYRRFGGGPAELAVTYDPHARSYRAADATDDAARIAKLLRAQGVAQVKTEILPVKDVEQSMALIHYRTLSAQAPQDCGNIDTMHDGGIEQYRDYDLGCTNETYLSRQISRPADLMGRADHTQTTAGRRAANVTDAYIGGSANAPLEGFTTTDSN